MTQRDAWVLYKVGACCHLPPAAFCHGKLSNNEEICLDLCDFAQSDLGNAGNSRTRAFSLCANFMKGANMLDIANKKEITKVARAVERALGAKGIVLSHGEVLNILAQAHGYKDYNAWKASLSPSRIDKLLTPAELAHVACSDGVEYGNEGVVRTSNGFELRFDAQDEEGTSYVRVCDPLGREIAYRRHAGASGVSPMGCTAQSVRGPARTYLALFPRARIWQWLIVVNDDST